MRVEKNNNRSSVQVYRRARHEAAHAIVAKVLGCVEIEVSVEGSSMSSGSTSYLLPGGLSTWDKAYINMSVCLGGQIVDVEGGWSDSGSLLDVDALHKNAIRILSCGKRPRRFHGKLCLDGLINQARQVACSILVSHNTEFERLVDRLVTAGGVGSLVF